MKLILNGKRPRFRVVTDASDEDKGFLDVRFLGLAEHYPSGRVVTEHRISKVDEDAEMEFGVAKAKVPTAGGGEAEVLDIFYALPLSGKRFKECKVRSAEDGIKATPPPVTETPAPTDAPAETDAPAPAPAPTTAPPAGGTKVDDVSLRKVYVHTFIFDTDANLDTSKRLECGVPYDCPTDAVELETTCPEDSTEPCVPPEESLCKVDCQQVSIANESEATARGSIVTVGKNSIKFGVKVAGWDFCYGDDTLRMTFSVKTGRPETEDETDEADTAVIRECTPEAECPPRAGPEGGEGSGPPPSLPEGAQQAPMQRVNLEIGGDGEQASFDVDECAYITTTDDNGDQSTTLDCDNVSVFARTDDQTSEEDKDDDGGKLFIGVQVPYFNTEMWWDPTISVGEAVGSTAAQDDVTQADGYTMPNGATAALVSASLLVASFVAVLIA